MRYDEDDPVAYKKTVVDRIVSLTKEARAKLTKEDPKGAGIKLGEALHTVHDSYSDAHTQRNEGGEITRIQDYSHQDSGKHKTADVDTEANQKNIDKAQEATEKIINFTLDEKFDEGEYRKYLEDDLFELEGEKEGEVHVEMGGHTKNTKVNEMNTMIRNRPRC